MDAPTRRFLERPRAGGTGYRIYEPGAYLTMEDAERVAVRGHRLKGRDEWLALLVTRIDEAVVGPAEAPYRPRETKVPTLDP